jgi:TolB protein
MKNLSPKETELEANVKSPSPRYKLLFMLALVLTLGNVTLAQDWVRIGTGLGQEKTRLAVADFAPRNDATKNHSQLFTQVVRDDLAFSGILDLVSPSFYPTPSPSVPGELKNPAWTAAPVSANLVAFGNLTESSTTFVALPTRPSSARSTAARLPTRKFANSRINLPTKSSAGSQAGCPVSPPRKSRSSAHAVARRKSG